MPVLFPEDHAGVSSELEAEVVTALDAAAIALLRRPPGVASDLAAAAAARAEAGSWFAGRAEVGVDPPEPPEPELGPDPRAEWFEAMAESGEMFDGREPADEGWDWEPGTGPPDGDLAWLNDLAAEQVDELLDELAARRSGPAETVGAGFTHRDGAAAGSVATGFAAGGQLDVMEPCPLLASFAQSAAEAGLGALSDDELVGYLTAARRMASWQAAAEFRAVAELDRRRQAAARRPGMSHAGEHVAEEVAAALTLTGRAGDRLLGLARALARLPMVLSALARGLIDRARAEVFAAELAGLGDVAAAGVAAGFWPVAGGMTTGQLRHALRLMVASLDPDAARNRAEKGRAQARVESWQESSGNGALAGRELAPAEMIAADQRIGAIARALKTAGTAGTLDQLRAAVFTALLLGRDPALAARPAPTGGDAQNPASPAGPAGPGPMPPGWMTGLSGSVHLTMPAATWLGTSDNAGEAAGLGPLDAQTCRDLAALLQAGRAAWHITLTGSSGRAVAHACPTPTGPGPPADTAGRARWLASLKFTWLEHGPCRHPRQTAAYQPPPRLRHLIVTRHRTCAAPGCRRQATRCDLDHTTPYDHGGRTCECDLAPQCRRHHKAKQAPGWHLEQPAPGTLIWTTPSGRHYTVQPDTYPA